jgi:hypothetical protein
VVGVERTLNSTGKNAAVFAHMWARGAFDQPFDVMRPPRWNACACDRKGLELRIETRVLAFGMSYLLWQS